MESLPVGLAVKDADSEAQGFPLPGPHYFRTFFPIGHYGAAIGPLLGHYWGAMGLLFRQAELDLTKAGGCPKNTHSNFK